MDSVKTAKFYPERINLYERKGRGGTPKVHLLGIDGRLKEGLREKLGLKPYPVQLLSTPSNSSWQSDMS